MKKSYLIKNPCLFQGEKNLTKTKPYFEGWYFKHTSLTHTISFIPGIQIDKEKKSAFIQVISDSKSYYINYPIEEFSFTYDPFSIKIGKNFFSQTSIKLNINRKYLHLKGELNYSPLLELKKTKLAPNIMGPFSFFPFIQCNHAIVSMKHGITGSIKINGDLINLNHGIGYIEKDYGSSFPSTYTWAQANCFRYSDSSLFFSSAKVPVSPISFNGFICLLIRNGKEYRFTSYDGAKIVRYLEGKNAYQYTLEKKPYNLCIGIKQGTSSPLAAPTNGSMKSRIHESIDSEITVLLRENDEIILQDSSKCCGFEKVEP